MDNQLPPTPQQPEPLPQSSSPKRLHMIITGLVGMLMLGIGLGGGYVLFANKDQNKTATVTQPTQHVIDVSPTITSTPQSGKTTNWKNFTSNYFGFTQQYPADWVNDNFCYQCKAQPVIDNSNERWLHPVAVKYPTGITYIIDTKENSNYESMKLGIKDRSYENKKIEDITVDGYNGVKVTGSFNGIATEGVLFANNKYIFEMTSTGYGEILDQILSTFKFAK